VNFMLDVDQRALHCRAALSVSSLNNQHDGMTSEAYESAGSTE
jgi:hypothetical protein